MAPAAVEYLKQCFDSFHKSGCIDLDGFRHVLHKALRIPPHQELPAARIAQFFQACDNDHSGLIGFDEFLAWWARYFHGSLSDIEDNRGLSTRKTRLPFEDFYRNVRPSSGMIPDPPCYFNGNLVTDLLDQVGDDETVTATATETRLSLCSLESFDFDTYTRMVTPDDDISRSNSCRTHARGAVASFWGGKRRSSIKEGMQSRRSIEEMTSALPRVS